MDGRTLNKLFKIGAHHALYREDGGWYHHLKLFPGVLFDRNGYVIFDSEDAYLNHPNLRHRQDLNVVPGISSMKEYVQFTEEQKRKIIFDIKEIDEDTIRVLRQINVIVRNGLLVRKIKKTYQDTCQICGIRLAIGKRIFYSEVHHIKPLGTPHNGPDEISNMICVCPNCHIQLDLGAIPIDPTAFKLLKHEINEDYIQYYNQFYSLKNGIEG